MSIDATERDAGQKKSVLERLRPGGGEDDSNKATDYGQGYSLVNDIGEVARFFVKAARALPGTARYPGEVLRQVGILIINSTLIIAFMESILAAEISLEGHYLLRQLGAGSYTGIFTSVGDYTVQQEMWGWVLTAKVGCGLVAEIGSMRISEEIDALRVMGIDAMSYLVGTRIAAMAIYTPFMFLACTQLMYMVNYFLNVQVFQSVSAGGFVTVHYGFITLTNVLLSLAAAFVIGLIIVVVGCFYGYNATGGPVGVGKNTAKSGIINMCVVSIVGAIFQQFFFDGIIYSPIGF